MKDKLPEEIANMSRDRATPDIRLSKPTVDLLAGFLSYLVPGLGQIYQGRIAKGVVFLVCLYTLFFYGLYLGNWQNVYISKAAPAPAPQLSWYSLIADRFRFLSQACIGVAAWPAVWQFWVPEPAEQEKSDSYLSVFERMPSEKEQNDVLRNSDKSPDLGWIYTVIAGALNILVIYDAFAGPVYPGRPPFNREPDKEKEARS